MKIYRKFIKNKYGHILFLIHFQTLQRQEYIRVHCVRWQIFEKCGFLENFQNFRKFAHFSKMIKFSKKFEKVYVYVPLGFLSLESDKYTSGQYQQPSCSNKTHNVSNKNTMFATKRTTISQQHVVQRTHNFPNGFSKFVHLCFWLVY